MAVEFSIEGAVNAKDLPHHILFVHRMSIMKLPLSSNLEASSWRKSRPSAFMQSVSTDLYSQGVATGPPGSSLPKRLLNEGC